MPLVYQQNINADTKLGVWHIKEGEDFFLKSVTLWNEITHPHKRLQHLAGRYLLRQLYPDFPLQLILIADTNKPYLTDEAYHFSISHCKDYACAIVSSKFRVGTDIEIPQYKITLLSQKFLKQTEIERMQNTGLELEDALTVAWSIKEAIFKWYGEGKVDFKKDIDIARIHILKDQLNASCIFSKNTTQELDIQGLFINGACITWVIT